MQKLDLSIIIPAFNEAQSIPQLYNLITDKLSEKLLSYEVMRLFSLMMEVMMILGKKCKKLPFLIKK